MTQKAPHAWAVLEWDASAVAAANAGGDCVADYQVAAAAAAAAANEGGCAANYQADAANVDVGCAAAREAVAVDLPPRWRGWLYHRGRRGRHTLQVVCRKKWKHRAAQRRQRLRHRCFHDSSPCYRLCIERGAANEGRRDSWDARRG